MLTKYVLILSLMFSVTVAAKQQADVTRESEASAEEATKVDSSEKGEGYELVKNVLHRYVGNTEISTISLMTCPYKIENKRLSCSSDIRKKKVKSLSKNYGKNLLDSKGIMLIVEPIAEYGIGILQHDYTNSGKDTDQWLYFPELDQVKRIASSADAPKKGSLFGSEFALEDMEKEKVDEYTYKILKTEKMNGREVTVVEQRPAGKRANKTNYLKRVKWIDTERFLVLKENYYELNGDLVKVSFVSDVQLIDDIWTPLKQTMRNVKTERISMIQYDDVNYNIDIDDEYLTQRILSDAVYRNKFLNSIDARINHENSQKITMDK